MTTKSTLLRDLEIKLKGDILRDCKRFIELCEAVDIDRRDSIAAMVSTLLSGGVTLALGNGVPPDVLRPGLMTLITDVERKMKEAS